MGALSVCCQAVRSEQITPSSVTLSNVDGACYGDPWNLINGYGLKTLNGVTTHEETDMGNSWATPSLNNDTYYYAWRSVPPVLTFQLDKDNNTYLVDGIMIWNYSPDITARATAKNCAQFITVDFSQDGIGGTFDGGVPITLHWSFENEPAQTILFEHAYRANAVRLTITDNWHNMPGADGAGDRVGLSEVRFLAPEPGSFLLLLSLGASAWLIRSSRAFFWRVFCVYLAV
jgi:hypothetical protein